MSAQLLDARLARVEGAFEQVDRRLDSLERRFESLEAMLEARFGIVDQRFNWLIGIMIATWITTILTVLFHR
jgi:tetrahydromethanopterin S-methyltransferase subunit G